MFQFVVEGDPEIGVKLVGAICRFDSDRLDLYACFCMCAGCLSYERNQQHCQSYAQETREEIKTFQAMHKKNRRDGNPAITGRQRFLVRKGAADERPGDDSGSLPLEYRFPLRIWNR